MTVEALQEELTRLTEDQRRRVRAFLDEIEDDSRLRESVADYQAGRTSSASSVHDELRERIGEA